MKEKEVRLKELDSLRGIACLMVVFFHFSVRFNPNDSHYILHYGYMGVDLFFMISGFVIFLTLQKCKHWSDFLVHRISRLYPAYIVCVAITYFVMKYSSFSNTIPPWWLGIFNATMVQHWIGVKDLDGVYWTLNFELSFYLFMLVIFVIGALKYVYQIVLLIIAPLWLTLTPLDHFITQTLFHYLPFFKMGYLFAMGILFYKSFQEKESINMRTVFLLMACYLTAIFFGRKPFLWMESFHLLLFVIVFILLEKGKLQFLKTKFLIFMGSISYTLYLIHENVGMELLAYLEYYGLSNWYVNRSVMICFLILLSAIISSSVEKPAQSFINKKWAFLRLHFLK